LFLFNLLINIALFYFAGNHRFIVVWIIHKIGYRIFSA
jgi:hypothetical protein